MKPLRMYEPSYRNLALVPFGAVALGAFLVLGTVAGQGEDSGPDCKKAAAMADMPDMPGMDHGAMASACGLDAGPDGAAPAAPAPAAPGAGQMDHGSMPGMDHGSMPGMDHGKKTGKKSGAKGN